MIINKKSQTELSGFYIVYKGSVLNEDASNYGISHLMEHLMCKTFQHLYDDFNRYSINWNAYTSGTEVVFHMKGLEEYMYKYRHEMLNSLLGFDIPKDSFEKELKVVLQEYRDSFQDQFTEGYYNLIRKAYGNYGPIGKLEPLESITYEDVMTYWEKYMSRPTFIVNISKNADFEGYNDFNPNYPKVYIPDSKDVVVYEKMADFNKSCVSGYIKVEEDFAYIDFALDMLGKSLESPLMKEIREKRGLTYSVHNYVEDISETQGLALTSLITTDENVDEVLDVYKMVLGNPEKYLTEERFNIMKDLYTVKKKKDNILLYAHGRKFIIPRNFQIDSIVDTVTFDKIWEVYNKHMTYDKWTWLVDKRDFL